MMSAMDACSDCCQVTNVLQDLTSTIFVAPSTSLQECNTLASPLLHGPPKYTCLHFRSSAHLSTAIFPIAALQHTPQQSGVAAAWTYLLTQVQWKGLATAAQGGG